MDKALECLEMMNNGIEYSEVRKVLVAEGYNKEQISEIIREADHLFLNQSSPPLIQPKLKGKLKIGFGLLLFTFSILISFNSFLDPNWGFYIVLGGPIIGGLSLYFSGKKDLRSSERSIDEKYFDRKWKKTKRF